MFYMPTDFDDSTPDDLVLASTGWTKLIRILQPIKSVGVSFRGWKQIKYQVYCCRVRPNAKQP